MKIIYTRRFSQLLFFAMFVWFGIVMTVGDAVTQLRGWPVNLFLNLDPLVGFGTLLSTHAIYNGLLWGVVTIVLTLLVGRFFCGWVCPFGSLHHFFGFLSKRHRSTAAKIKLNRYRKWQAVKYYILFALLAAVAMPGVSASLFTGVLDPIPLVTRSLNMIVLPIANRAGMQISTPERFYQGAWLIFSVFAAALFLNFWIPRFYCRFICPLGALFGLLGRFNIFRIGKIESACTKCNRCEVNCEGGCEPSGTIRLSECVLCMNCLDDCRDAAITYSAGSKTVSPIVQPDVSRRGFALSIVSGFLAIPAVRVGGALAENWNNKMIRPPGALGEEEFLKRCIKCGQCMRVCPTNVIQPGGLELGLEGLWTPVLNNRIGSSGCQMNCVACGQVCPTAAIRPITLDEKLGNDEFAGNGPIRMGTAFFDRNRCLPWAKGRPCLVCEENCPVSPKAIYTREHFETVRDGVLEVEGIRGNELAVEQELQTGQYASGDHYCLFDNGLRLRIEDNTENSIKLVENVERNTMKNVKIEIQIRLQRPFVDISKCIGCGVCEHECPVSGKRAVRVYAEGETRETKHKLGL